MTEIRLFGQDATTLSTIETPRNGNDSAQCKRDDSVHSLGALKCRPRGRKYSDPEVELIYMLPSSSLELLDH
jgi:hypothetical protein